MAHSEVYGVGPELLPPSPASRAALQQDGPRQLEAQGSCPGGRHCTCPPCPPAPVHGCCLLHFPDDPCADCPAAHPDLEQHCADCGIGETEQPLADFPRHGSNVLLCGECSIDHARRVSAEDLGWEMDGEEPDDVL